LVVHCKIFGNPEPTIKWFKDKIPLNLCTIPRYKIWNHPDDLHEHTIASIVVEKPSYLDNGDYIIEVSNEMGSERRVLNVQFQTEDEFNALYFQKYMEHKEIWKYHEYKPGEVRWEDVVPEVKEFVFWEPPEEEKKVAPPGKKKIKVKRKIIKKIITPWGDEKEEEVTDEDDSGESVFVSENEESEGESEEEEEDAGWNVPGEVVESEHEDEPETSKEPEAVPVQSEEIVVATEVKELSPKIPTPTPATPKEESPVKEPSPKKEPTPVEETPIEPEVEETQKPEDESTEQFIEEGAYGGEEPEVDYQPIERKRKEDEVEHPIILRRPKFYITDFQLRKKFYFVNKLIDVEMLKGKTLRMQSVSSSIGPVTCEWRHNGRLIKAPTARKTIEFYPRKNQTILEIENTRVQDSGTYTVTVYNDYTEPLIDSCKVMITVPKPKETADQPPTFTRLLTGINHYRLVKF
jgi:hypothetical protein